MMLPTNHLLFYVVIFFSVSGCIDQPGVDPVQENNIYNKTIQADNSDTSHINHLNSHAYQLRRTYPDSAFYLSCKAYALSKQTGYKKGIGNAFLTMGFTHLINYSKNDSASFFFRKADSVFSSIKDIFGKGMVSFGMAYVQSFKGNLYESEKYLNDCLGLFRKVDDKRGIYNAYNSLAYIHQKLKNYGPAYDNIINAILTAEEMKDTALIADGSNSLGNIYKDQYLFKHAIDAYYTALTLWESKGDSSGISIAYGNIGLMYYYLNDYSKALEFYKKKLPVSIRSKNTWEESRTYNNIGSVYLSVNKHDTALTYYRKGLNLNKSMTYPPGITESYHNLANTFFLKAAYDSALYYVNKSIFLADSINARSNLAGNYVLQGKIQLAINDEISAMKNLLKGYKLASRLKIPDILAEASKILSQEYKRIGNFKKAYNYLLHYKQLQDSIKQDENIRKIAQLEMQYEFDKKQRKNQYIQKQEKLAHLAAMKQQRIYLLMAIVFIIFIILSAVLIIRQKNLALKFKTIDLEQKLLRVQMNPHFIFNSLCAIQDYILNNKKLEANAFLTKFASLVRSILETSKEDYVILEQEINVLKNYMDIQKMRFETDFSYHFYIDENIDTETVSIPPMLAQPFIENAIEHGLLPKKDKGSIFIRYKLNSGLIRLEIEDNGIGRKNSSAINTQTAYKKHSLTTPLTFERIKYLQESANRKTRFKIVDLENISDATGTKIIFLIPYRQDNI